ncbi:MAG: hypothetical protein L0099_03090 [Acidobacteria bacterium]|nr:hypothetical protein [Acidobacteriota bacterium]
MRRPRAEVQAGLMQQAAQAVEELLDWADSRAAPTLTEIEDQVLKLRQRLSAAMAQGVMEAPATVAPAQRPVCPACQRRLHFKAKKGTTVESRAGRRRLERGDDYCEHCRRGIFPPG